MAKMNVSIEREYSEQPDPPDYSIFYLLLILLPVVAILVAILMKR